jgi:hypothetical protein
MTDGWRHPLARPPAVILDEDDHEHERRATVRRDPPADDAPATRDLREQLPGFLPDEQPDPGPPQAADQADAGGHSLTDEESRWLD